MNNISFEEKVKANAYALERIKSSDPYLVDVRTVEEVVPNFKKNMILTSGAPLPWEEYTGGQRNAILSGALFEGLAENLEDAESKITSGEITIAPCHDFGCIGSVTGIYTASMPVFVVEDRTNGNRAFCSPYEGAIEEKITYGLYTDNTRNNLLHLKEVVCNVIGIAVRESGGIALRPIIRRAINMGDELHSRNTAASLLFSRHLFPYLLEQYNTDPVAINQTLDYLNNDYNFLRLAMAACKVTSDTISNIKGCSIVTAMTFSCKEFAIRVSGLGDQWFRAPLPKGQVKLFEGYTDADVSWMGGESCITETMGLGGFVQAAAFTLQDYSGGTPELMIENNNKMYEITLDEHPEYKIPVFQFRGAPLGIDIHRIVESGITPVINMGVAHKDGGQIGAGVVSAPTICFEKATKAYNKVYIRSIANAP
ncbi:DUF1116 domain-containing protein [Sporosarcina sp. FSL W7-1349]|uniref:DUF1116 domain-containing protein n=1 Tax=Sporosarcina sp. FSL W7-1349 TaxID=2921561 RepID=UPI0030FAF628